MMEEQKEQVKLTIDGVKNDLSNGLTRSEIQNKYGLTKRDVTALFKDSRLKGLRAVKPLGFVLVEETTDLDDIEVLVSQRYTVNQNN